MAVLLGLTHRLANEVTPSLTGARVSVVASPASLSGLSHPPALRRGVLVLKLSPGAQLG